MCGGDHAFLEDSQEPGSVSILVKTIDVLHVDFPVRLYGCELWALIAERAAWITAFVFACALSWCSVGTSLYHSIRATVRGVGAHGLMGLTWRK